MLPDPICLPSPAVLEGARKQLADQRAKASELQRLLAALG